MGLFDIDENEQYDTGVNLNNIFTKKNLMGKGFLNKNDPMYLSIMLAIQHCNYEKDDILELVVSYYIELTGSVEGKKNKLFIEGAGHRVAVIDGQKTVSVEGES